MTGPQHSAVGETGGSRESFVKELSVKSQRGSRKNVRGRVRDRQGELEAGCVRGGVR